MLPVGVEPTSQKALGFEPSVFSSFTKGAYGTPRALHGAPLKGVSKMVKKMRCRELEARSVPLTAPWRYILWIGNPRVELG